MEPLDRATIWPYRDGEPSELYYQRDGHPNGVAAERELGELEGGEALLFPSGTGAATAVVLAFLEPGQTIALAAGLLLRHEPAVRGARALGRPLRRVRPDRAAA